MVIAGDLGETHVDLGAHRHRADRIVARDLAKLGQELLALLDADLRQEVLEYAHGLFLLGCQSLSLNIGVDLGQVILIIAVQAVLVLGSNLCIIVSAATRGATST